MSPGSAPASLAPGSAASVFGALGDETRLRLLARLSSGGPASIARLSERAHVTRQAITKHLEVLAQAGLVRDDWRGRERIWRVEQKRLAEARAYIDLVSRQWDDALDRLKRYVEGPGGTP
jgi:DNA-binding transcriptional ArsR family regulator